MNTGTLKEKIILLDADGVDGVAMHLRGTFREMLKREVPLVDTAEWIVCCALDGGLGVGEQEVQVIFVRSANKMALEQFTPGHLVRELDGQAFRDPHLGEFLVSSVVEESVNAGQPLFVQCVEAILEEKDVNTLILVPDMVRYGQALRDVLQKQSGKDVTLLSMRPESCEGCRQDILGYSLMHAMGIEPKELEQ